MSDASLRELDRAWLHPFTSIAEQEASPGLVIAEGRGSRVRDASGRWYLDAMAGLDDRRHLQAKLLEDSYKVAV